VLTFLYYFLGLISLDIGVRNYEMSDLRK
jgi:hypothetical protein